MANYANLRDDPNLRYLVQQPELSKEGKLHFQGYAEFKDSVRGAYCQKMLNQHKVLHVEPRMGTRDAARDYCMYDKYPNDWADVELRGKQKRVPGEVPFEYGKWDRAPGTRTDIVEFVKLAKECKNKHELTEAMPAMVLRYPRGTDALLETYQHKTAQTWRNLTVEILWGAPGIGKTRRIYGLNCEHALSVFSVAVDDPFPFNGYSGEDIILFDDFDGQISQHKFLGWLDGYPIRVNVKGSHIWAKWTRVVFTSNFNPESWWKGGISDALKRRITKIERVERVYPLVHVMTTRAVHIPRPLQGPKREDAFPYFVERPYVL